MAGLVTTCAAIVALTIVPCFCSEEVSSNSKFTLRDIAPVEYEDYILVCDQEPLDLAFIVDASASIWKVNFTIGLEFVRDFIDMYDIGPNLVRIAVVTFGRGVYDNGTFSFNEYEDKKSLLDAVTHIDYASGLWTGTGDAINHFTKKQYPDTRPGIPHLCIVLTDGNSQESQKTKKAAAIARSLGVKMFAIGVGDNTRVKDEELVAIAGSSKRTFRTNNYAGLNKIKKKLAFQTCVKKPKPTTPPAAQPCGIEFPADIQFIYDAAMLGTEGNSFVTQFGSHTFNAKGMKQGMQLGVTSALCPDDEGFNLGTYTTPTDMKERLDKLYDPKRLGNIVKSGLAPGLSAERGGRSPEYVYKVAVVFVGGKIDTDYLAEQLAEANQTVPGGIEVFFSDVGGQEGTVNKLAEQFYTYPLTGTTREQSALFHSAICG